MKAPDQGSIKTKRPGIREIAEKLGVSIGTVDRALHNRPGISPLSRKRVQSMAKALGYQPNLAARFLSSRKQITIAVNIPREIAFFFDRVRDGLLEAAKPFEPNGFRILYRPVPLFGQREVEILEETLSEEIDGLVIAPGYPEKLRPVIRRAARRGIPVVCVGTDAPGSERLTSVSEDPYLSGCVVGELIGRFLPPGSRAIVVTGILATLDHAEKVKGFRDTFGSFCHNGELVGVIEAHDDQAQAYDKTWAALKQHPDLAGIYVTTANSLPVMRVLEDLGVAGKIVVITTDLFPELVPLIQSGRIVATMDEQPREQGRLAFESMYRFLVDNVCPPPAIRLASHIVMKSNLKSFLQESRLVTESGG
jgi:LacI family transcriptional regulator